MPNIYETNELLSQYMEFHYGEEHFGVKNFLKETINLISTHTGNRKFRHALDVGCAVGRGSLELSKIAQKVHGIDNSSSFIDCANTLLNLGYLEYQVTLEGNQKQNKLASLDSLDFKPNATGILFEILDAEIASLNNMYDLILISNVIDRLKEPEKFLRKLSNIVEESGYMVISSPNGWSTQFTEEKYWLCGVKQNGIEYSSYKYLQSILQPNFTEIGESKELPFVIRETAWKYQHSFSQVTIWQRKRTQ